MLSEIFLNSRNEAHLARVSIFIHLVTDHIFIYPFILYRLFYFILFHFILFYLLSFIDDQHFFITQFFFLFCDNLPCSGMFRNVPGCSGMFHVPAFVDALYQSAFIPIKSDVNKTRNMEHSRTSRNRANYHKINEKKEKKESD